MQARQVFAMEVLPPDLFSLAILHTGSHVFARDWIQKTILPTAFPQTISGITSIYNLMQFID